MLKNFHDLSADEQLAFCRMRAIEWLSLPPVLLQSFIPVMYLFFQWYFVLGFLALCSLVWPLFRKNRVSSKLVVGAILFGYARWPSIILVAAYLIYRRNWGLATLTLSTTLIVAIVSSFLLSRKTSLADEITIKLMRDMGYEPPVPVY